MDTNEFSKELFLALKIIIAMIVGMFIFIKLFTGLIGVSLEIGVEEILTVITASSTLGVIVYTVISLNSASKPNNQQ